MAKLVFRAVVSSCEGTSCSKFIFAKCGTFESLQYSGEIDSIPHSIRVEVVKGSYLVLPRHISRFYIFINVVTHNALY